MRTFIAVCVSLLSVSTATAEPMRAGAAMCDITPPTGYAMWGYGARRDTASTGVRDRLMARAVVLEVGKAKIALVSLDLGRAPTRDSLANIRKLVNAVTQIETLFLVASHTHHGPVLELDDWPCKVKPYIRELERKLAGVIIDADKKLQPARMGVASHDIKFNRNRHSKRADKPVDREMLIARFDDTQGRPIAHLVHFAAHPTMLPAKLLEFSHDFPGFLAKHVEKELGGVCLFLQGAAGDLSPNPPGEATPEAFGQTIGQFVVTKSKALKADLAEPKELKSRERDFRFSSRIDLSNPFVYGVYSLAFFPKLVDFYEREYRDGVRPHVTTALLDKRIGFAGVSGELFTSQAIHLKRRARLEHLFVFGYCNDYQQYFPTIEAIAEGGYGADFTVSPIEIGAGERMMDQTLLDLLDLQGKIRVGKR